MNQYIIANDFLNYLTNIQIDQNINDWICKGRTNITYGSPNGGWDGMNGFLFVKIDNSHSYVIRSIPKEKSSYIVIESLNIKGQLYNMDLSNPRICKENQGKTYLLESYRMTVGKGKMKEIDVENTFKSFKINNNEISIIEDSQPDWSKTLNDILEWAILREKIKLDLKNNIKLNNRFDQIINDFKTYIRSEKTKIKGFTFQKIYPKYVWITDSENKIGKDGFCHYELITRNKHPNKIFVEIHFDEKRKQQFKKLISDHKNEKTFWNNEHEGGELSLAYHESYDFEDENLFTKLDEALFYLESNFGELIRSEFKSLSAILSNQKMTNQPLNQILYGPPGTGKTYNSINKALKIINEQEEQQLSWDDRKAVKNLFDKRVAEGRIVFTTFHQSMSYEDFIEGIKPKTVSSQVQYEIEYGMFKSLVKKALVEYIRKDSGNKETNDFDIVYNDFIQSIKPLEGKRQGTFKTKTGIEIMLVDANDNSILVKYLWSDNSKKDTEGQHVFSVTKEKLKKVLLEGIDPSKIKSLKSDLHPLIGHIHCELFAVYKKFYDFVIDNKGEIETIHFDEDELSFEDVKEQFDLLNTEDINAKIVKPFVIIIDEINRGNVSQIFGELITLIEEDKRLGKSESLEVTLPYSKDKFGVPANLFIIGTMNTADRSIEALDTALRRRFCFEEMPPLYHLDELKNELYGYTSSDILKTINQRIEKLLDKDHKIGHSYLLDKNNDSIIESFYKNIIPLLQEYFFGDYCKIGLVLGQGFVRLKKGDDTPNIFAKFDEFENELDDRNVYEIIDYRKDKVDRKIKFHKALQDLMNK